MKKIKYLFMIFLGAFILGSCSEDVLDIPALGKYIGDPDPNRPIDYAMVNSEAMGLYRYIDYPYESDPKGIHFGWGYSNYVTLNVASDDAVSGGASAGDRIEYEAADKFTLNGNNNSTKALFEKYYTGVAKCNKFLDTYPVKANDSLLRNIAEVKFLRGYYYFNLVNFYGGVPLATKSTDAGDLPNASIADIYAQIEKDMNEAISSGKLPASKSSLNIDDKTLSRITVMAARAILGKVYVFHSTVLSGDPKWNEAKVELEAVKNSGEYRLVPNYDDLWSSTYEMKDGNPENILEVPYTDAFGMDWAGRPNGNLDMQLMGIRDLKKYPGMLDGWGFCKPTQKLVDAFISENDSIRLDNTVVAAEWPASIASWEASGSLRKSLKSAGSTFGEPYNATGYWNGKYRLDEKPKSGNMFAQNEVIMRYAEVLLLLAEVEYNLGNGSAAMAYVNETRHRAKLDPKTASGASVFNEIVKEKQLELAMESIRFWDLLRWNLAATEIPEYNSVTKGLWPFPYDQLAVDPNLKQNPGY